MLLNAPLLFPSTQLVSRSLLRAPRSEPWGNSSCSLPPSPPQAGAQHLSFGRSAAMAERADAALAWGEPPPLPPLPVWRRHSPLLLSAAYTPRPETAHESCCWRDALADRAVEQGMLCCRTSRTSLKRQRPEGRRRKRRRPCGGRGSRGGRGTGSSSRDACRLAAC